MNNDSDSAKETLRLAFEENPSSFAFSCWQKLVRTIDGIQAARNCFSDIYELRKSNLNGVISHNISKTHAKLELDINSEPKIAYNILKYTQNEYSAAALDVHFISLFMKVLVRLGDFEELRWFIQSIIDGGNKPIDKENNNLNGEFNSIIKAENAPLSNQQILEIYEEYFSIELSSGICSINFLNDLRVKKDGLKLLVEKELIQQGQSLSKFYAKNGKIFNAHESFVLNGGIMDYAIKTFERFISLVAVDELPSDDSLIYKRLNLTELIQEISKKEKLANTLLESRKLTSRGEAEINSITNQLGVPDIIRKFLMKLPQVSGLSISPETFVERLRRVILPPPPAENSSQEISSSILEPTKQYPYDNLGSHLEDRQDIFRARQRQRLA